MVFLFTDAHVAEESFLELINNMLTSGDTDSLNYCQLICLRIVILRAPLVQLLQFHPVSSADLVSCTFQYYLILSWP